MDKRYQVKPIDVYTAAAAAVLGAPLRAGPYLVGSYHCRGSMPT